MLSLFRNNQVTSTIPLALYVLVSHAAALLGYVSPPETGQVAGGLLYTSFLAWVENKPILSAAAAAVLVFIQALLVNNLADEFRLLIDRSWLPGLFYVLVASCLPEFLFLSAPLIAVTFIPVALRRIFRSYKKPQATALIFDAAFWLVVGSLFYPPAFWLLLAVYAGVNVMRSFNLREQLVFLTGAVVPFWLIWLGYFWYDQAGLFAGTQFRGLLGLFRADLQFDLKTILKIALLFLLLLTVLLSYGTYFYRKLIHAQKCITVLYWVLFIGGLSVFLRPDPPVAHFLLLMPSIGILLAHSFATIRNTVIAEIVHLALLGTILFIQFFPAGGIY